MIKIISFDLQGTLSDARFSDEFWRETLPQLYAKIKGMTETEAVTVLKDKFSAWGKYDYRYYSLKFWLKTLNNTPFKEVQKKMKNKPLFFADSLDMINGIRRRKKVIILSSTTREFMDIELAEHKALFSHVYSSLDDFHIAGKPPELYLKVASVLDVKPEEILHIGDSFDMDIGNANAAGLKTFYFDRKIPRKQMLSELNKVLETI
jgi:HAD superfamily hydrolase (TIGR01549 family)